jgi:hypothetical protein
MRFPFFLIAPADMLFCIHSVPRKQEMSLLSSLAASLSFPISTTPSYFPHRFQEQGLSMMLEGNIFNFQALE